MAKTELRTLPNMVDALLLEAIKLRVISGKKG